MKKRSIGLIIGLMGFALLGVMAMQLYFLRQSYQMQSELFDRSVNEALNNVVSKVSKQDAMNFLSNKAQRKVSNLDDANAGIKVVKNDANKLYLPKRKKQTLREKKIAVLRDSLERMIMHKKMDDELANLLQQEGTVDFQVKVEEYTDELGVVHGRFTPQIVRTRISGAIRTKKLHKYDTLRYVYIDPQFGKQLISVPQINPLWQREQLRKQKERQVAQIKKMLETDSLQNINVGKTTVIENLAEEYRKTGEPLNKRINPFWIDSLLRFELHNKGISLPFSYEVTTANSDSLIFSSAIDNDGNKPVFIAANTYQTPIFGKDVINDPGKIRLSFPQKNSLILRNMTATMGTTGGLLMVLIFCFGYTIFSILKQKKVSEMKIDFINNMTHEFKTPVSTIMIASEALKDAEITEDKSRVSRLANIIFEENARLGSHIERVLNIARIEKNDFKLDKKPLDVNDMVTVVIDSMALKLHKFNAKTTLDLTDENTTIIADELHFSNVLYNLVDNAIKYSADTPDITITTLVKNGQVLIQVADKGIGMSRDQQTRIFEQFYRIPTGNLHDVKGFGLGLSYVNTIVKRLNGTISVRSEKDKGSEFELKFPQV
ncbi:two-component system, OmpR family, phosphate regulon sensor histidine kinase PhoR [Mucilaginibacter lappiensis]|uniref:histidine kinase n=1 Tax=Mucilaginibacter lappiensis TaxID=354630 RepID=A0ABR6PEJ4_9SPHI|nr:HAMP domain-containing sensor histidine kinase [Mucilaginibacter lappiensis]MBB6108174.1 two-component system phosphate regulon sensor histidine kinase PhoR [Mucilaginibacter lappiensis]SIQ49031.1 two-component system, OmpR family, phosphate regulon sensor histidine kinase PhoR [Mucilaginibacter lappiensis]